MTTTRTTTGRIETTTTTSDVRETARCKRCKGAHSRLFSRTTRTERSNDTGKVVGRHVREDRPDGAPSRWACCGGDWGYLPVAGILRRDIECNARCQASKGHECECSCGGRNHGASHG